MRVVRFTPQPDAGLGTDPLFGILEEDNQISIISGSDLSWHSKDSSEG